MFIVLGTLGVLDKLTIPLQATKSLALIYESITKKVHGFFLTLQLIF